MANDDEKNELLIQRVLPAPRRLVYDVWSELEHLVNWWGPKDFSVVSCHADIRVGGRYRICMRSP